MNACEPILVIGGTRGTGLLIARLLNRQGQRVGVLARDHARALTLFDAGVQVVPGNLTKPETLRSALDGARHIIFTAGCRSGYPVREPQVKTVEYEGVLNTLAAARQIKFAGRFLYMNSSGLTTPSLFATCLNLWKGKHPDLVLMDLEMPVLDGYAAARQIKAVLPSIRVIALTVHDEALARRRASQAGVDGFIVKGEPIRAIIQAIHSII